MHTIEAHDPLLHRTLREEKFLKLFVQSCIGILVGLCLLMIAFIGYSETYAHTYYPRTTIGGIAVAGLTRRQAKELLSAEKSRLEAQILTLADQQNFHDTISLADLGATIDLPSLASDSFEQGHEQDFWQRSRQTISMLFSPLHANLKWQFDEGKFIKTINDRLQKTAADAKNAEVKIDAGSVQVEPAQSGQHVDVASLHQQILDRLDHNFASDQLAAPITLAYTQQSPDISTDEASRVADQLRTWIAKPFVLKTDSQSFQLSAADILRWATITQHGKTLELTLNQDAVENSLNALSPQLEKKAVAKQINAVTGEVLEQGQDGLTLDRQAAYSAISQALTDNNAETNTVNLVVKTVAAGEKKIQPAFTPGMYPGKYIEVDLSSQHLVAFDGDQKFMEAGVSTGKWSTPTPIGTFAIQPGKSPRAWSSLADLWMPDWMPFIGNSYGIHALPEWPNGYKEGADHIGTPVSHGCIRLTDADAEKLYPWADVGTVVYVHA